MKALVKSGDSRSNGSRDTRPPHFVTNDDDDVGVRRASHKGKTSQGVLPKNQRRKPFDRLDE